MPTKDAAWWRAYRAQKKVDVDHFVPPQVAEAESFSKKPEQTKLDLALTKVGEQAAEILALREEVKMLKRKLAEKPVELVSQPLQWLPSDNPPTLKPWQSDLELGQFRTQPFTPVPKIKDKKAKA